MAPQATSAESLEHDRIGKLLLQYSIPAIIAMTAASLYNIIDRIFIGQGVGPLAISGLALTFPLMNLAIAFGALVGAGASTLVSIRLGEKRHNEAAHILGNTVLLNIIISTALSVMMFVFLDELLYLFGASSGTLPYAKAFMQIILAGNVFFHSFIGLNNIMRASGYPRKAMTIMLLTVGINLVLAPLFIFVFRWGIRGAAFATVAAHLIGLVVTVFHFTGGQSFLRFRRRCFTLDKPIILSIFSIGMPSFIINISSCLIIIILNLELVKYGGDYAVGAFGIISSIIMCIVMVIIGLTQGMQPIAGYNYGARRFDRVIQVFRYTTLVATAITTAGFLMGELFPRQIALAFTENHELIDLSVTGMRLVILMFPIVGFQIVASNFFQSIGHAKIAIGLSLSRQVLFLIPALLILPLFFGLEGVWASLSAADLFASLLTFIVLKSEIRKIEAG